ncbi:MAG: flagellar basal body-associated FliL family protein [Sulfitobacter sp.]
MKKLIPLVLVLVGTGAGVGAGIFLRPDAPPEVTETTDVAMAEEMDQHVDKDQDQDHATDDHGDEHNSSEYVQLSNQFVVPLVSGERVAALVVLALSIEVPAGGTDLVLQREPKLRDSFLQILFDHANMGGFDGNFTDAQMLDRLRRSLKEVAQKDLGKELVQDVLIVEIARQDY